MAVVGHTEHGSHTLPEKVRSQSSRREWLYNGDLSTAEVIFIGALNKDRRIHGALKPETSQTVSLRPKIGGSAPLSAIGAHLLGIPAGFMAAVGQENECILREIADLGVPFQIRYDPTKMTPESFIHVDPKGNKYTSKNNGYSDDNGPEAAELYPEDARRIMDYFDTASAVFCTSFTSMPQVVPGTLAEIFREAKERGVRTFFDMSEPGQGWTKDRLDRIVSDVFPYTEVFSGNEKELYVIASSSSDEQFSSGEMVEVEEYMDLKRTIEFAHRLLDKGVQLINVHYGEKGTVLVNPNEWIHLRPPYHDGPIFSVGAGNAQCAGTLVGLPLAGDFAALGVEELDRAARYGNAAAHLWLRSGDFPSRMDVEKFVRSYDNHTRTSADVRPPAPVYRKA